jgi:hypothetical protein
LKNHAVADPAIYRPRYQFERERFGLHPQNRPCPRGALAAPENLLAE